MALDLPPDWPALRAAALARHGARCAFCGVTPGQSIRGRDCVIVGEREAAQLRIDGSTPPAPLTVPSVARAVLHVAHLRHDRRDRDPAYLVPLCRRCHFAHDREDRAALRFARARARGQLTLPQLADFLPPDFAANE